MQKSSKEQRVFKTCRALKAWRFFQVLKTGNLAYLIDTEELPEGDFKYLAPIWDNITEEYDKLSNKYLIQTSLENASEIAEGLNKLNGLRACYDLLTTGKKEAIETLKYWGVNLKGITLDELRKLKSIILQEQTRLIIENDRIGSGEEPKQNFIESVVKAENVLNRTIDGDQISIEKWVFIQNSVTEKIAAHGKQQRNKLQG